jgi:integrase
MRQREREYLLLRLSEWQVEHPDRSLTEQVATFLEERVALSMRGPARGLFRRQPGLAGVNWGDVRIARYRRDEARLRATVLSETELSQLWSRARLTVRQRALCAAFFTLRRMEVAHLKWDSLSLDEGLVYVARGKGGKAAWTALPPVAVDALRAWRAEAERGPLIRQKFAVNGQPFRPDIDPPRPRFDPAGYVFPSAADGRAYNPDALGCVVRKLLQKGGLWRRYRGPHAFRRTFATTFLRERPGELRRLQVLMRHSHLATTVLYDYPEPKDFREAVAGLRLGA